jgi:hypothetical protein
MEEPMRAVIRRPTLLAATLLLVLAGTERGLAQIEMSLYGGMYVPTADVGVAPVRGPSFPSNRDRISWRHTTSATVGGRLTIWLSRHLGVEAVAQYSLSDVAVDGLLRSLPPTETDASVVTATGRAVWRLSDPNRPVGYHVLGGLGFVTRSSRRFANVEGTTDLTFVLGVGLRAKLGPRVDLRLDTEDYLYWSRLVIVGPTRQFQGTTQTLKTDLGSHFLNDLVFSLGLAFQL